MTLRNTTIKVRTWSFGEHEVELVPDPEPLGYSDSSSYLVLLGGIQIGRVFRTMFTRERRTRGRRYVNARWESLGWCHSLRVWEQPTRQRAVEDLVQEHLIRKEKAK